MYRHDVLNASTAALAGCLTLLLSACGDDAIEATALPQAGDAACSAVAQRWPATVGGKERVEVSVTGGPARSAAAWGDPAVIARCGAPELAPTRDQCLSVDDVDWVIVPLDGGTGMRLTTYGRSPALEVLVPSDYAPEPLLLPAFSEAAGALPTNGRSCI